MINREGRAIQPQQAEGAPENRLQVVESAPGIRTPNLAQWGPIWSGLLAALTVFLVLEMFLYWIGGLGVIAAPDGTMTAAPSNGWVSAIVAIISFFVGGWVATSSSAVRGSGAGTLNGFLVWALGIALITLLSMAGLGAMFGAAGNAVGQVMASGHAQAAAASASAQAVKIDPRQVIAATRDAAGWGFLFFILSAIAAAIGGMMGERSGPMSPAKTASA